MNFYISAGDDQIRHPDARPIIGSLLCKSRDRLTVEYALRDMKKTIGIAQWQACLIESLPKRRQSRPPTVAEIEKEFGHGG
jgi:hypothetical protein